SPDRPLSRALHRRAAVRLVDPRRDVADPRQDAPAFPVRGRRRRAGQRGLADARQPSSGISVAGNPDRADARDPARFQEARAFVGARRASRDWGRHGRLLRIPYAYTVPLAIINLLIVGYLQPYTEYRYESLRFDLNSGALGAAIKVGEFNQLGKRLTLRIDRSENKGTQLHGIF